MSTHIDSERPGHLPTVFAAFLHFDLCFMLWVLLGALGIPIAESLRLAPSQKALMVALPILAGSLLRIPLGLLSDRFGGRRVGLALLGLLFVPLALGWQFGESLPSLLLVGLLLGSAGASFAVVLPMASKWYPAERQGLVMGLAAAGNSGTVIANLLAPRLAAALGWHTVLGLAMLPLSLVTVAFALLARDNQAVTPAPTTNYATLVRQSDLWWFCVFYLITFGGYVGLSSFLPILLRDQFSVTPVTAGSLTALAAFTGSGLRPLGGYLADRIGGTRLLSVLLLAISLIYAFVSRLPALTPTMALLVVGMAALGMGNGAVFQLVPLRFSRHIGSATGLIGAVGGIGGFLLPMILGSLRQQTGSFGSGFAVLASVALAGTLLLQALLLRNTWRFPKPTPTSH